MRSCTPPRFAHALLSGPAPQAWLDPFLRETVSGMMLWPRRMVIPILPEEVTGPLDELYLRCGLGLVGCAGAPHASSPTPHVCGTGCIAC